MYADRKGWPLKEVTVDVSFTYDKDKKVSTMDRQVELKGGFIGGAKATPA